MRFQFVATPRMGRLKEITCWLREESESSECGFYCNITVINKAFVDKDVFCVTAKNRAIGFAVYTTHRCTARIEIAEVCPSYRGSGAGRFLVENCLQALAKRGVRVVDLECEPKNSESFWRHMEFCKVPSEILQGYSKYNKPIRMFRPTCQIQNQKYLHNISKNIIELFDCEPWASEGREPKWSWPIFTVKGTTILDKPIIHPADKDWCVRWKSGDRIIKVDKVKYFCDESFKWGDYLILTQLPQVS
ncbi:MAG TPA: GNAT family N-acetyltransferase [Stenomitos sp.]